MTARARKPGESYPKYRKALKVEAAAEKTFLRGTLPESNDRTGAYTFPDRQYIGANIVYKMKMGPHGIPVQTLFAKGIPWSRVA